MSKPRQWRPGDRVLVELPDRDGVTSYRGRVHWFAGTVRDVDTGPRPGVRVDLDTPLNGCGDAYATHSELRAASCRPGDPCALPGCPCMPAGARGDE